MKAPLKKEQKKKKKEKCNKKKIVENKVFSTKQKNDLRLSIMYKKKAFFFW